MNSNGVMVPNEDFVKLLIVTLLILVTMNCSNNIKLNSFELQSTVRCAPNTYDQCATLQVRMNGAKSHWATESNEASKKCEVNHLNMRAYTALLMEM